MKRKDCLDIHTHTIASGHAYNSLFEMVDHGKCLGLELLGISDHAPAMPGSCHRFYFDNMRVVPRKVHGQRVMHGTELNIMNRLGHVDLDEACISRLDYTIASLHPPCFQDERTLSNVMSAYEAILYNPYVTVIGHPDDGRFPVDYEFLVRTAKETSTLLELNNSSLHPDGFRPGTHANSSQILKYCMEYEVPVILGSDAHICYDICNHVNCWNIIEETGFPSELIVNEDVSKLLAYIRPEKLAYLQECWDEE